jgi:hypothetical protein
MRMVTLRALLLILAICLVTGCSGSIPSTELPSGREVAPALEFPELRDYRGIVDCRIRDSGIDQSKLAEIAVAAQIDFIFLCD